MFFSKELKNLNKEIANSNSHYDDDNEITINIKANSDEQIFSSYNYDNKTSINSELANYLWDNAKLAPPYKHLKLQIFCKEHIEHDDVKCAIQSHYRREYIEINDELKKSRIFSFVCLVLGIISIISLLVLNNLNINYIITTIMEIVSWVFIWEAVDSFFLKGSSLKRKCIILIKLYSSDIVIISNEINNTNDNSVLIGEINEN